MTDSKGTGRTGLDAEQRALIVSFLHRKRDILRRTVKELKKVKDEPGGRWALHTLSYYDHAQKYISHMIRTLGTGKYKEQIADILERLDVEAAANSSIRDSK